MSDYNMCIQIIDHESYSISRFLTMSTNLCILLAV